MRKGGRRGKERKGEKERRERGRERGNEGAREADGQFAVLFLFYYITITIIILRSGADQRMSWLARSMTSVTRI